MATESPTITRVVLENYKSIAVCDVTLNRLTFLVGPNGSGKSNFLDALHFVADALRTTISQAVNQRGGIDDLICRAPGLLRDKGRPHQFSMQLELALPDGATATYAFSVASLTPGQVLIEEEVCEVRPPTADALPARFHRKRSKVTNNVTPSPLAVSPDRLYLVNASGLPQFGPVYEALNQMIFYNLNPASFRVPQQLEAGAHLAADGSNIASILRRFEQTYPRINDRVQQYLAQIVPGLHSVRVRAVPPYLTLQFHMQSEDGQYYEDFAASSMSDGTLRALGVLVALFQSGAGDTSPALVAIEEPEAALHPGATAVLLDALRDASEDLQVIVTTHSADILDDKDVAAGAVLAAVSRDGVTILGPMDDADRSVVRDRLYTVGELMRQGVLTPEPPPATGAVGTWLAGAR